MKDVIVSLLDELAKAERSVVFLTKIRKITLKVIMHRFLGSENGLMVVSMDGEYAKLNYGLRAMAINLPGFAYHKALKARKNLVKILQDVIDGRRAKKEKILLHEKMDMVDLLLDVENENGRKLDNEEITDVILMYLNAGHESTAHATLWAILFLYEHPEYLQKAKAEQEEILRRSPIEERLSLKEIKQMELFPRKVNPRKELSFLLEQEVGCVTGSDLTKLSSQLFLTNFSFTMSEFLH